MTVASAVLGAFLLGIGVGWIFSRKASEPAGHREHQLAAQLRHSVIPILERQADAVGLPRDKRSWDTTDDFQVSVSLAQAIRAHETGKEIGFSDTVEAQVIEVEGAAES